jgi:hypothetical protein
MSEFEYYEFQAIDRALSADDVRALRAISSRATITPTHFSNFYNYGSLKANPHDLLVRYFDVFVYLANWRFRELAFRFPKSSFDAKAAKSYAVPNGLTVRTQGAYHLLMVSAECPNDGTEFEDDDGRGWLSTLAGLRADVAAGDQRLLYLAWLMGVQAGEMDDDAVEPPCPPGLDDLSGTLESFVDFAWLDPDLVAAAAEGSEPQKQTSDTDIEHWVDSLSATDKTQLLVRVARRDSAVAAELSGQFRRAMNTRRPVARGRRVGELVAAAERRAEDRRQVEHKRAAEAERRRQAQEQRERDKRLDVLARREDAAWREVETLIASRQPKAYSNAAALLVDLRAVAERADRGAAFAHQLKALRARHANKPALLRQLRSSKV